MTTIKTGHQSLIVCKKCDRGRKGVSQKADIFAAGTAGQVVVVLARTSNSADITTTVVTGSNSSEANSNEY